MIQILQLRNKGIGCFSDLLGGETSFRAYSSNSSYSFIILGALLNEQPAGILCGVIPIGRESFFSIDKFYINRSSRRQGVGKSLFQRLIYILQKKKVTYIAARYFLNNSQSSSHLAMRHISESFKNRYSISHKKYSSLHYYPVQALSEFKKWGWYTRTAQHQELQIESWSEYPESMKREIHKREDNLKKEEAYLSPFLTDPYDENTSLVLIQKTTEEPVGWIITEAVNKDLVIIRRFYIYDRFRSLDAGPILAGACLKRMIPLYSVLCFKVLKGNRSMKQVTERYFQENMIESLDEYFLELKERH